MVKYTKSLLNICEFLHIDFFKNLNIIIITKPTKSQALVKKGSKHMDDTVPLPEPDPLALKKLITQAIEICTDIGLLDFIHALLSQATPQT